MKTGNERTGKKRERERDKVHKITRQKYETRGKIFDMIDDV